MQTVSNFRVSANPDRALESYAGETIVQVMLACKQKFALRKISLTRSYFSIDSLQEQ